MRECGIFGTLNLSYPPPLLVNYMILLQVRAPVRLVKRANCRGSCQRTLLHRLRRELSFSESPNVFGDSADTQKRVEQTRQYEGVQSRENMEQAAKSEDNDSTRRADSPTTTRKRRPRKHRGQKATTNKGGGHDNSQRHKMTITTRTLNTRPALLVSSSAEWLCCPRVDAKRETSENVRCSADIISLSSVPSKYAFLTEALSEVLH
ncbi:unnamed protein product [Amoebophrya sp. A25]|nr:unnamed protein product [Amoebophrya sp. A25]|eukprot:GSA25T00013883001.1